MRITVLGSGSNGGVPQWDCCCPNCTKARADTRFRRTRSSVAISLDGGQHILIDATPDLKLQLETVGLVPKPKEAEFGRQSRIDGVLLTHGHGDHCVGIAEFSTGKSFEVPVYAPHDLIQFLFGFPGEARFFSDLGRLARDYVKPHALTEGDRLEFLGGLRVTGFQIDHTDSLEDGSYFPSSTFGYELKADGGRFIYTPDLGLLTDDLLKRVEGANLFMLDGTFWWNDELTRISGLKKTSYELGHVPIEESLEKLRGKNVDRVVYTHFNHTNPLLDMGQPSAARLNELGFEIAYDGMTINL